MREASFLKLAEWSEQLRPVTSVRPGAIHRRVQIWLCTEQRVYEKLVWNIFTVYDKYSKCEAVVYVFVCVCVCCVCICVF